MRTQENETTEKSPSSVMVGVAGLVSSFLVLSAGCNSEPALTRGKIIDKRHETERTWIQTIPVRTGETTTTVPVIHTDDEDWILVVSGQTQNGEETTEEFYVEPRTYESVRIGEEFEYDPSSSELDDPVQKREK